MPRLLAPAFLALALTAPAAAQAADVQVVNERGISQGALWTDGDGPPNRPTDDDGWIRDVAPGTRIRVTRSTQSQACQGQPGAPEGAGGVAFVVPDTGTGVVRLPNATGDLFKPASDDAERWIAGQVNKRRAERGLPPVRLSGHLNRTADALARRQATGQAAFPPPFCPVVVADWGFPRRGAFGFSLLDAGGDDPRAAWEHWSDGSVRETSGTLGNWNAVGIGDGDGAWIAVFARCPEGLDARCEISGDQGDPSIVLPERPPSQQPGGAPGGSGGSGGTSEPGATDEPGGSSAEPAALRRLTAARRQRGRTVRATVELTRDADVAGRVRQGRRVLGKTLRRDARAGTLKLRVPLSERARRALKAKGRLRVTLEVVVDPGRGKSERTTRKLTVRR